MDSRGQASIAMKKFITLSSIMTVMAVSLNGCGTWAMQNEARRAAILSRGKWKQMGEGHLGSGSKSGGNADGDTEVRDPSGDDDEYSSRDENMLHPSQPGDLGIRFNKFDSLDGGSDMPHMGPMDYPIQGRMAQNLRESSNAVSIISMTNDPDLDGFNVLEYLSDMDKFPTYPDEDPDHPFWDDFRAVVFAQRHRLDNGNVEDVMVLPDLWSNFTIHDVAEAVHNEYPGENQAKLLESFFIEGALPVEGVEIDCNVIPCRNEVDFVGGLVRMAELNTWAVSRVSAINFSAKWAFGRARPEEVAWLIYTGEIPEENVPTDVFETIMAMDLNDATDFTAYEEGSPRHPSWPAMHSAASSASFWMSVVFNLTAEQYCQALLTDYAVSYARTVAGVHYPSDNLDGLTLGQMVVADALADKLVERFGSNRQSVQNKIEAMRFDWNDFDPNDCSII